MVQTVYKPSQGSRRFVFSLLTLESSRLMLEYRDAETAALWISPEAGLGMRHMTMSNVPKTDSSATGSPKTESFGL